MDPRRGCAEPPAAEPPAGRINKTAFKLFKRRKGGGGGGGVPSIFGVRSGGGEGKAAGGAGLVRSRTHDGLAEAAPEGGGKDEPAPGREAPGGPVAKSHSFFSLLRKNGKAAESAERRPGGRQKKGLRSIFGGVRWHRKDKAGKERRGGDASESPPGLTAPGSLTASLECVKEEQPPKPPREPAGSAERREERPGAAGSAEPPAREDPEPGAAAAAEDAAPAAAAPAATAELPVGPREREPAAAPEPASSADPPSEPSADRICLMFADVTSLKSFDSLTGCGDIIADREEDAGGRSGEKGLPGAGKPGAPRKRPGGVAYQGGGEEMASPEQADDTCLQDFWDMLSHAEEPRAEEGGGTKKPEGAKENRGSEGAQNRAKRGGLHHIPIHLEHKAEPQGGEKEQPEGVPNSDEGYWDSTTPGPEEDGSAGVQKETLPRDSYSGDALYDLYAEPDETPPAAPGEAAVTCPPRSKPVSPAPAPGSLRTPSSAAKDSKIPISIKHLSSHPAGHGADAANSHHVAHHHPAKSDMHRTKIPVSKVLVRRVSNRGLAGTSARAAAHQDGAKK